MNIRQSLCKFPFLIRLAMQLKTTFLQCRLKLTFLGICLLTYYCSYQRFFPSSSAPVPIRKCPMVNQMSTLSPRKICNCSTHIYKRNCSTKSQNKDSTCSEEATSIGPGQKVISFVLYGPKGPVKSRYNIGHWPNVIGMRKYYPGWVVRIYSDYILSPDDEYCYFLCENDDVFWCNVTNIPGLEFNATDLHPMSWRFLPYADPLVDIMMSRDIDSRPSIRDATAVAEWLNSSKVFHSMRDHPFHSVPILGGMWGAKTYLLSRQEVLNSFKTFIEKSQKSIKGWVDQPVLEEVLYVPKYYGMFMAHDQLLCKMFYQTLCLPFPTPYDGIHHVGKVYV